MAHHAELDVRFTYDEQIDTATKDYLQSRADAFAKALPSGGVAHWTFIDDTSRRRFYQLRKNSKPPACYVELTLDEIQSLDDTDIERIITHQERPCIDVNARLDRWVERLTELCVQIETWCAGRGWTVEPQMVVQREEPLMRLRGAAARKVPTLTIHANGKITRVVPRALFAVGANGIVDIFSPTKHFTLLDRASDSAAARDWNVTDDSKTLIRAFNRDVLTMLAKGLG